MKRSSLSVLPKGIREDVEGVLRPDTEEIRVRANRPVQLRGPQSILLNRIASAEECETMLELVCAHSLFAYEQELRGGYVTLEDGSRVGICGRLNPSGSVSMPGSFNIRIAREIKGAADGLIERISARDGILSALILSDPGAGKTTVLRDAARQLSAQGLQIGIADERGEIAASVNGVPRLDIGDNTDVMGGCAKCRAMELMIRAMSPQVLITDEIATAEDAEAVMDASGCGIRVIASAHAGSAAEIMRRRDISGIIAAGAFNKVLLLKKQGTERRLYDITEELT